MSRFIKKFAKNATLCSRLLAEHKPSGQQVIHQRRKTKAYGRRNWRYHADTFKKRKSSRIDNSSAPSREEIG